MVQTEQILVVSVEASTSELISNIVTQVGYNFIIAKNFSEAEKILKTTTIPLLIIGIQTGERDKIEWIKFIRKDFPDIHITCITQPEASAIYNELVNFDAIDYISTPSNVNEIRAKLNRVIQERRLIKELTQKSLELEMANEELKRLDKLKSTFIENISHELRTPLTVVEEFISHILEGHAGPLTEDQKDYLGMANKNILRLTNLIENLLDFSRIESGKGLKLKFEPTILTEVIDDASMTLSQQLEEKQITFENRIDPDIPLVFIDRNRMVEVFINLIDNSIKFTPPGGKITIDSRGLTEQRNYLKVVVADTGVGISPEDLPKIFDRFYQGQRNQSGVLMGTGLGLAIAKEIVEGHQGNIHAESKFGSGASFVFTIPVFGVNTIYNLLLIPMLDEAERDKMPFSLIRIDFWDSRTKREIVLSHENRKEIKYALQKLVRVVDAIIPFQNNIVYVFSFNENKMAKEIGERIQTKLTQKGYFPRGTEIRFRVYTYPLEARTKEEFLKGCQTFLKES